MKSIWLSALVKDEAAVQKVMGQFKAYGIELQGHFWQNDNAKMGWLAPKDELLRPEVAMWAILGSRQELEKSDLRYGLSLLALAVQARKGFGFPIVILQSEGNPITTAELPDPLQRALVLPSGNPATPAKLVAKVHAKTPSLPAAYHLDMVGNEQLGQWLQVYPDAATWPGIIFGVDAGEILFQAVGTPGKLPQKATLNYAMQGLKLEMGGTEFTAWATQNEISDESAYFVKISGTPGTILFGPYSEQGEAEMYTLRLA
jgi:hypothetical protein